MEVSQLEMWDRLLGFSVLPLLGRELSPAHGTKSPQCKASCNTAPSMALWAACVRLWELLIPVLLQHPCLGSGDRNANLSVSAKADCKDLLMYTAVVGAALLLMFTILNLSSGIDAF